MNFNILKVNKIFIFLLLTLASCHSQPAKQTETSKSVQNNSYWLLPFNKLDSVNPVLQPAGAVFFDPVQHKQIQWEAKNVYNPAIVVKNDTMFMLYRAQDSLGCSRIGLAKSVDGIHFVRDSVPVLFPENDQYKKYEWPGGCEDPRITSDSIGNYYMTYTSYDGKTARLMVAVSKDLHNWQKKGLAFQGDRYKNMWSKSGSVISTYNNESVIAKKIDNKYWMFWGDKKIWLATSTDLIHWSPIVDAVDHEKDFLYAGFDMSKFKPAVNTRKDMYDCDLVESGPPAMFTDKGILLIYNGRNIPKEGDKNLPEGTYTVSQVLLDKNDPSKTIARMNHYFLKPQQPYELNGEVNNVCFAEGLAFYKNKWWLYYGTADSKIAVAVKN